jgi:bifunctional non-homologous end joining protein LigD
MPITWTQVRTGLDPKRFDLRIAPKLMCESRAWAEDFESERSLEQAIRRLSRAKAA